MKKFLAMLLSLVMLGTMFAVGTVGPAAADTTKKYIALTFDDGPTRGTSAVLDKLEEYGIPATFMLIGNSIDSGDGRYFKPDEIMKRQLALGCEIGNHTATHPYLTLQNRTDMIQEIEYVQNQILAITGTTSKYLRPPYLNVNTNVSDTTDLILIGGVGSNDWDYGVTAEESAQTLLNTVKGGDIILLHDTEANSAKTPATLDILIPALQEQGYEFVTVSGLFEAYGVTPINGVMYNNVLNPYWFPEAPDPFEPQDSTLTVSSASGDVGDTVEVQIRIDAQQSLSGLGISIDYDDTALELAEQPAQPATDKFFAQDSVLITTSEGTTADPYQIVFDDSLNPTVHIGEGGLINLKFRIKTTAASGSYPIKVTVDSAYNFALTDLKDQIHVTDGSVTVVNTVQQGDVTGDGYINNKDLARLKAYLADDAVEMVVAAADVAGKDGVLDGYINNKDYARLKAYVADPEGIQFDK